MGTVMECGTSGGPAPTIHELVLWLEAHIDRSVTLASQAEGMEQAFIGIVSTMDASKQPLVESIPREEVCIRTRLEEASRILDISLDRIQRSLNRME